MDNQFGGKRETEKQEDNTVKVDDSTNQHVEAGEVQMNDNRVYKGLPIWAQITIITLFGLIIPSPFVWKGFRKKGK